MFSSGPNYNKLKTNLRLAVNRLKLLEKKKTELTQKARKEIADYISNNKEDRARIRVEHIIREDYLVEAYELLEMYCDMLLARFGLISQMKTIDPGIEEAVNSVLWAAPRLMSEVQELKLIADQLVIKYGKPFAEACRENGFNKANPKLIHKMSAQSPPKILVEKYMIEIAKSHNVPFTPDADVMRQDEVACAEAMLIDFQNRGQQGYGWQYPPGPAMTMPPPAGYVGAPQQPAISSFQPVSGPTPFNYPPLRQDLPPSYDMGASAEKPKVTFNAAQPGCPTAPSFQLPNLPDVPTNLPPVAGNNQNVPPPSGKDDFGVDFDDLTRRFEDLKKKK